MKIQVTTITISRDTKKILEEFGRKGESFDQIIRRLLNKNAHL